MLAFQFDEVKKFMSLLFQNNDFDFFLVKEASVQTAVSFSVNGRRNMAFYDDAEAESLPDQRFITWGELKPQIFQMIRGSKTPHFMALTFLLPQDMANELLVKSGAGIKPEQLSGAYINIRFQAGKLRLVTAVGFETFLQGKAFEHEFDRYITQFLNTGQVSYTLC